jgi:hypothetical protein
MALALLQATTCYDILPLSHKLIVLETTLLVKKGLAALLQHGGFFALSRPSIDDSSANSLFFFICFNVS